MNSLEANIRDTKSISDIKKIRNLGFVPGILYGGKSENQKISVSKKNLKNLMEKENFLSRIINLKINGQDENVLPKDIWNLPNIFSKSLRTFLDIQIKLKSIDKSLQVCLFGKVL